MENGNIPRVQIPYFPLVYKYGVVAQWLEQGTHNTLVVGSIPTFPTMKKLDKLENWLDSLPEPAYVLIMAIVFVIVLLSAPTIIGGATILMLMLFGFGA